MNEIETNFLMQRAPGRAQARTQLFVLVACEENQAECAAFRAMAEAIARQWSSYILNELNNKHSNE